MAPVQWSNLPGGIIYSIANLLNSDIDFLRLRSVCSSWRSSLPPPQRPISFPIKLPPIRPFQNPNGEIECYSLRESILHRISPPNDPSDGWMFKVSESIANSNNFSLIIPLSTDKMSFPPGTLPKSLNLLDHHIHEICKSYSLQELDPDGSSMYADASISVKKVIALSNYIADCEFAVLTLHYNGEIFYWKLGDENWNPVDTKDHRFNDMILYEGKCLAIDGDGVLIEFDRELQLKIASSAADYSTEKENRLVHCGSDLYLVSKAYGLGPEFYHHDTNHDETAIDFALILRRFNKLNSNWDSTGDFSDKVFLLGEDVSAGVFVKDFKGCEGNCVYLADWCFIDDSESHLYGDMAGVYHLENHKAVRMAMDGDSRKLYWPPPSWLVPAASSSEMGKEDDTDVRDSVLR